MLRKHHLHSEQFDGRLHAECGAGDFAPPCEKIVSEDEFAELQQNQRCRKCANVVWPYGGERYSDDVRDGKYWR